MTGAEPLPERVAAAASIHGGNLTNDSATSLHLLPPQITREVYVAGTDNDQSYPPEMAERLEAALSDTGVVHRFQIYEGTRHGWMMPDFQFTMHRLPNPAGPPFSPYSTTRSGKRDERFRV